MKQITSGGQANYTGRTFQKFIENSLISCGYVYMDRKHFQPSTYLHQPTYSRQFGIGKGLYDGERDLRCDFILYHPQKHTHCLVIEAKWQKSGGSIDEKFPYVVTNIQEYSPYKTVVVLDGGGYKPHAEKWLRDQVGDKLVAVYNMREFQTWINNGGI